MQTENEDPEIMDDIYGQPVNKGAYFVMLI
jgi:hypothetical protein